METAVLEAVDLTLDSQGSVPRGQEMEDSLNGAIIQGNFFFSTDHRLL